MNQDFSIAVTGDHGKAVVLAVKGSLDARNMLAMVQRCSAVRESGRHLLLNLAQVDFLASSAIGALLAMTEEFETAGLRLRITSPSTVVQTAISLLNLDELLSVHGSDDDALTGLAA